MGAINNNKINNNKLGKALLGQLSTKIRILGLSLVLINFFAAPSAFASEKTELVNIFLSDSGSLILETKDKKAIQDYELLSSGSNNYKLILNDSKIDKKLIEQFNQTHQNYQIKNETVKESLFKKHDKVSINVECLNDCHAQFEPLLGGLAYKLNLDAKAVQADTVIQKPLVITAQVKPEIQEFDQVITSVDTNTIDIEIEDEDFQAPVELSERVTEDKSVHILQINKKENFLFALTKEDSPVEEFLNDLDEGVANKILTKKSFRTENIAKADSASLSYIAEKLNQEGHVEQSAGAYAKALEVDPNNLNAMLGLARTTANEEEKLHYYLKAVDDQALLSIGQKWFEKGIASGDSKQIAQAMVSYQFAVLKNPANPYYRYEYARALEQSGFANFDLATKRYLEAAVLAKKDYKAGDIAKEDILRMSTECLIKVLTKKGAPDKAVHYCNSYMALGFKKFLDGRSIKGVMKEISSNKNPFQA